MDEAGHWAWAAGPQVDRAPARPAAAELGRHPAYVAEAAGLLSALLRLDAVTSGQLVAEIVRIAELVDGRPVLAGRLADLLGRRTTRWRPTSVDPALLLDAAGSLAERGDLATGLFAVALARHGRSLGWPEPWRVLLRLLRRHPVADVRDAALGVSMAAA
ncbi:hypothetical protein AB0C04_30510 [Micromonospora sp. NPDC048909]|uniref:hypothetical protein n=1 Tax=Micromonospora sp. NPDC048909 TaxID=3155643 RepID=UPI0033F017DD